MLSLSTVKFFSMAIMKFSSASSSSANYCMRSSRFNSNSCLIYRTVLSIRLVGSFKVDIDSFFSIKFLCIFDLCSGLILYMFFDFLSPDDALFLFLIKFSSILPVRVFLFCLIFMTCFWPPLSSFCEALLQNAPMIYSNHYY